MPTIDEILKGIGDASLNTVKAEFKDLLTQAKGEQLDFVKETALKMEQWLALRVKGELNDSELEALLRARKRAAQQDLNTLGIQARARVEKVVLGILDIALNTFLGKFGG